MTLSTGWRCPSTVAGAECLQGTVYFKGREHRLLSLTLSHLFLITEVRFGVKCRERFDPQTSFYLLT